MNLKSWIFCITPSICILYRKDGTQQCEVDQMSSSQRRVQSPDGFWCKQFILCHVDANYNCDVTNAGRHQHQFDCSMKANKMSSKFCSLFLLYLFFSRLVICDVQSALNGTAAVEVNLNWLMMSVKMAWNNLFLIIIHYGYKIIRWRLLADWRITYRRTKAPPSMEFLTTPHTHRMNSRGMRFLLWQILLVV